MSLSEHSTDRAPVISAHAPIVRAEVLKGPGAGQSILLRRAVNIIGSLKGCKVRLSHKDVSSKHCAVVNTGGDVFLRDLGSRTGTYLNDLRAEHERIQDGDAIKVSQWEMRISVKAPELNDSSDFTGLGLEPAPAMVALENAKTGEVVKLTREINLLGRRQGCDFVVEDRSISRAHALVFTYLSNVAVFDLGSQNGTHVNGQPVTFSIVKGEDVIRIGDIDIRVRIIEPSPFVSREKGNGRAVAAPKPEGSVSDRIDIRSAELDRRS